MADIETELRSLDPKRQALIRHFYYRIAESLPQLIEELEFADLDLHGEESDERSELLNLVCGPLETMAHSFKKLDVFGKVL